MFNLQLQGRKLRTEFKKVLKEGEKERIERDKALKRIRSRADLSLPCTHLLSPYTPSLEPIGPPIGKWNRREASAPGDFGGSGISGGAGIVEEEDYGQLIQGPFSGMNLGGGGASGSLRSGSGRDYTLAPSTSPSTGPSASASTSIDYSSRGTARTSTTSSGGGGTCSPASDVGTSISARMGAESMSSVSGGSHTSKPGELVVYIFRW